MYNKNLIDKLTEKYNMPLYIFKKDDFIENYLIFNECFQKLYSKYRVAYSYKTNYTPEICKIVKSLGGYAEVVSDMEYYVAKKIGYKDENIVYNGPIKGPLSIQMLLNGGILNADNLEEVKKICNIAIENPDKKLCFGLRVNIDIGQNFISRFGIDTNSNEIDQAFEMVEKVDNLEINGLHCHIGQSRTIQAWRNRVKVMLELVDKYFTSKVPKYIDLGSGMFANMNPNLAKQFGKDIPTFEEYADVVATAFNNKYKHLPENEKPILFTEPGTTLINSYIDFIGKVTAIKKIKGKQFIILNCSKDNLGDICKMKQLPIHIIHSGKEQIKCEEADFVGYTCLEHDVMYKNFNGNLSNDDYVVFENIGGYSNVSKPPFISQNCAMISMDSERNTKVIKKAENFEDIFKTYVF